MGQTQVDASPHLEYKCVGVSGFKAHDDEPGVVTAIVAVTGKQDNVKDIIEPGAFKDSLANRMPKGVWHHKWEQSVSKTLGIKELLPGDPDLPKELPTGEPWPKDAGGLQVKTQFNLETQRGREAYSDVVFFGDQQEWSIGYNVPVGKALIDSKSGVRRIRQMDLYEYSPVLFGAMPAARTASVKEAQLAYKSLIADPEEEGEPVISQSDDTDLGEVDEKADDIADLIEAKGARGGTFQLSAAQASKLHRTVNLLIDLLRDASILPEEDGAEVVEEEDIDAEGSESISTMVKSLIQDETVQDAAEEFEAAHGDADGAAMEQAAEQILDAVEKAVDDGEDPSKYEALTDALVAAFEDLGLDEEDDSEEEDTEEEEPKDEEKVLIDFAEIKAALE